MVSCGHQPRCLPVLGVGGELIVAIAQSAAGMVDLYADHGGGIGGIFAGGFPLT